MNGPVRTPEDALTFAKVLYGCIAVGLVLLAIAVLVFQYDSVGYVTQEDVMISIAIGVVSPVVSWFWMKKKLRHLL